MRQFRITVTIVLAVAVFYSCKKDTITIPELASIDVINAGVNAGTLQVNNLGTPVVWKSYTGVMANIAFGEDKVYSFPAGNFPITIVRQADTLNPVFSQSMNTIPGEVYSLYVIGLAAPYETILVKESDGNASKFSYITDSSLNVRVINLSPNAPEVNVTLSTSTTTNEFANLAYKQSSEFKNFPAKSTDPDTYTFQVRKASDNSLITSVSVSATTYKFKNITLMLRGLVGGSPAAGVTIVKNY